MREPENRPNRELLLPFLLPYLVYTGIASIPGSWLAPAENYAVRLAATAAALIYAWRHYPTLVGPRSLPTSIALGTCAGALGTVLWIALVSPFAEGGATPPSPATIVLRLCAATLLVPVFEELLMRGYLLRLVVQWDRARRGRSKDAIGEALDRSSVHDVEPGAWTPMAVVVSTVLFAAGHGPEEWAAAVAYGGLMAGLWIVRGDLASCVVAHGVTNLALGAYVIATDSWRIW